MSSQLRGSVFGNRIKSHTIVIARGERVRHWTVPSWLLGTAVAGSLICVVGGIGAIALSFTGDSVVRMMMDREVRATTVYEKRISGLRQELDKLTTLQHIDRDQISKELQALLSQQAQLVGRFQKLEPLLDQAADAGLIDTATTGSTTADGGRDWDVMGSIGKALSPFKAARPDSVEHIRDVVLPSIRESVGLVEGQQAAGVAKLSQEASEKVDRMTDLLGPLGVDQGEGGIFVPPPADAGFDAQLRQLEDMLSRMDDLRGEAERLPIADPKPAGTVRTSTFGIRSDPFLGREAMHTGVDFAGAMGTPVRATGQGRVVSAGDQGGYGLAVEIDHGNGVSSRFAHLSRIDVSVGQAVTAGSRLGLIGTTGRSTGPHLHYEVRVNGEPVNPQRYIDAGHKWAKL
ncbi:M23 family metallopeptidase [Aureimonas phyllosphaerae]|uniref:Murein DD-endopeptidase MepM/ murein hydrolase activator NlpD n=1 Tax=Aureimonas phyllosphaerae TaxID=1166078 RepID=A0A7W6BS99_9HYPH|nr:M23 family metallopeptidase [Aureimonas phyllosphaerae]MBB3935375.1 murein DD-endopeptidase MepM/ murein hydrolase activator NlpD [Aureimonas phyllosphaerae]MBB3959383.1 murein DD-endopeptidase MepM/ murein hydrolase activator NlpD [Aureimonas phyllosphaerae]SFF03821.1 Murein DD-endopeptidase MepM and murein hydrolase activator NlpD, contain LysM domain [Aureimonas phyllosphaerae]